MKNQESSVFKRKDNLIICYFDTKLFKKEKPGIPIEEMLLRSKDGI